MTTVIELYRDWQDAPRDHGVTRVATGRSFELPRRARFRSGPRAAPRPRIPKRIDATGSTDCWRSHRPALGLRSSPRPIVLTAKAAMPCHTRARYTSADIGGAKHAETSDSYLVGAACADLRDHRVWPMKRCGRHCLRRCCDGQSNGSNSDQSDHWFWCIFSEKHRSYSLPSGS